MKKKMNRVSENLFHLHFSAEDRSLILDYIAKYLPEKFDEGCFFLTFDTIWQSTRK